MRRNTRLAWLGLGFVAGCGAPDGATRPSESGLSLRHGSRRASEAVAEPTFFGNAPGAPPLAAQQVSFWAVKGQDRRVSLFYQPRPGRNDSTEFLRFRVRSRSLLAAPGGVPFQLGDSVLITLTVADSSRLIVEFQPAGLQFDPDRPAELEFRMDECDLDLNGDGVMDGADRALLRSSQVFRQETLTDPWVPQSTLQAVTDFRTKVNGFTRYVVAY